MVAVRNPTLDSISAFTHTNGSSTTTATVSYTGVYAPAYVSTGPNTYTIGKKIYISGAESPSNNGWFVIASSNSSSITYSNANGVTASGQFALCSPASPVITTTVPSLVTTTAATPVSYTFTADSWNPPPVYIDSSPTNDTNGTATITSKTVNNVVTTFTGGSTVTSKYPPIALTELYPYKFGVSLTLPVLKTVGPDDGTSSISFDSGGNEYASLTSSKCNIFTEYSVGTPKGLAFDSINGVLYVVDADKNCIRKIIVSSGVESIIAGGADVAIDYTGNGDGYGTGSVLFNPIGIALDVDRQILYVSELDTGAIRKIDLATLQVTTERVGNDVAQAAIGLAYRAAGNLLYIANNEASAISVRNLETHTDAVLSLTGGTVGGPLWLAIDETNNVLYIAEPSTVYTCTLGVTNTLTTLYAEQILFGGITYDAGNACVYVGDNTNNRILVITLSPILVSVLAGSGTVGSADGVGTAASFNQPTGIVCAGTETYVADTGNSSIRKIVVAVGSTPTYAVTTSYSFGNDRVFGVAIDSSGNKFVTDKTNPASIHKFTSAGVHSILPTSSVTPLVTPHGIISGPGGYLYVADSNPGVIKAVNSTTGAATVISGDGIGGSEQDTNGLQAYTDTFQTGPLPSSRSWNVSACSGNGNYIAVGYRQYIYVAHVGSDWVQGTMPTGQYAPNSPCVDIASSETGVYMIAVYDFGYAYKSSNYGASWSVITDLNNQDENGAAPVFVNQCKGVAISPDGATMYIYDTIRGSIFISTNGGLAWTTNTSFPCNAAISTKKCVAVQATNTSPILAVLTDEQSLRIGTVGGTVTTRYPGDGINNLVGVAVSGTHVAVITDGGYIWLWNGSVWAKQRSAGAANWTDISASTPGNFVAVSTNGAYIGNQTRWVTLSKLILPDTSFASVAVPWANTTMRGVVTLSASSDTVYGVYTDQTPIYNLPQWLASDGSTYYITSATGTLRRFYQNVVSTLLTGLTGIQSILISGNYLYFAVQHMIIKIYIPDPENGITIVAGAGDGSSGEQDGIGTDALFNNPTGLALDASATYLYVSDNGGNKIRRITLSTTAVTTLAGTGAAGEHDGYGQLATFNAPAGIALSANSSVLYIVDTMGSSLRTLDLTGTQLVGTVYTNVLATIPLGTNAITISGTTYLYTAAAVPTITCTADIDDTQYRLVYTTSTPVTGYGLPISTTVRTDEDLLAIRATVVYSNYDNNASPFSIRYTSPSLTYSSIRGVEYPAILPQPATSPEIVPLYGTTDNPFFIASDSGFTAIPTGDLTYVLSLESYATGLQFQTNFTGKLRVTTFPITVTPTLVSPLTLYTYQQFSYVFSLPDYVVNVTLNALDYSSSAIGSLITSSSDGTVLTFSSPGVNTPMASTNLNVNALAIGSTAVLGSSSNTFVINQSFLSVTPSILSGVPIDLYKYEAFNYTFTIAGNGTTLTLRSTRSSPQLAPYISLINPALITFTGTPPASYSSTFTLAIDLMNGTTVVTSLDYPVTISAGRVKLLPSSPYTLYQYERISNTLGSNISWSAANSPDSIISVPTLPYGLSFSNSYIVGIPQTQQPRRNYQLIASNSTNGSISTSTVSFTVGVPIVRITPSAVDFTGLGIQSTPTTTFTALVPVNPYRKTFRYLWSPDLPSGLVFSKTNGQEFVSSDETMPDDIRTISLSGTPNMTDASGFPSSGIVSITLSGIYKDSTNVQTIGTSKLTLQFAETVLMTASASSNIYVGKALGSNDVVVTAASYFPSTSGISNFTTPSLPAGVALASNSVMFPTRWWLTGTPTVASSSTYTFTATNSNAITKSASIGIQTKLDVVRFSLTPSNVNFIVSKPLDGLFQVKATADSGSAVTYSTTFNLATYGLSLNSTTGILTGTPTSTLSNNIVFTATSALGVSSNYVSSNFQIVADTFTWPTPTFSFFQNRAITPYQLSVTTVSGRTIQSFSSTNMPAGLILNPSGLISGTPTGTTGGTFTVTASTGYQAPPTASQSYTYTVVPDNLLVIQQNGVDSFSNSVFTVPFTTIQYSTGNFISPVYSFTTYPPQYPAPVFTLSQSGVLSGNFTGVPAPYALYNAGITATYGSISNTTNVVISIGDAPKPLMLVGYWIGNTGEYTVKTTSSYVFSASVAGTPVISNQTWSTSLTAGNPITGQRPGYPDLAMSGTGFVAVTPSNVYDGIYNSTTGSVTWSNNTPTLSGAFGCVASDGNSNWIIVEKTGTALVSYERYGNTGSWTKKTDLNGRLTNSPLDTSSPVTIAYINGNYVYGQGTSGVHCNVLYKPVGADRWSVPTTLPALPFISKFATNNTTIVAIGYATAPSFNIISYSTTLTTWITPTQPAWLTSAGTYPIDIAYGGGMWVVIGGYALGGFIVYSPDLSNWTPYSPAIPIGFPDILEWDMQSVAFNGNAWTISASYTDVDRGGPARVILTLDAGQWPTQTISISTVNDFNTGGNYGNTSRILATAFSNTSSFSGTVTNAVGSISFRVPRETDFVLYQYVPYSISARAVGVSGFIYYYATGVPIGFQFVSDSVGYRATLSGISPSNGSAVVTLYAKTASSSIATLKINLRTVIPYFVNPQSGAAAYTAILRDQVDANAAQNARDKSTFPQVDSLAGPFMAPRAPDAVTQSNCFLGLCKKPCPTCRTTL
jgi:sugar lactone lactonase YvrE